MSDNETNQIDAKLQMMIGDSYPIWKHEFTDEDRKLLEGLVGILCNLGSTFDYHRHKYAQGVDAGLPYLKEIRDLTAALNRHSDLIEKQMSRG